MQPSCRARLATVILFQLPVTLRLTTLFHTSYCLPHILYCLPPVSVACYIPLLPGPTSCIYRGLSAIQNKQSSHTAYLVQQYHIDLPWIAHPERFCKLVKLRWLERTGNASSRIRKKYDGAEGICRRRSSGGNLKKGGREEPILW